MGFFNKILKGLGFEEEEEHETKPKKVKEKKVKNKPVFATFDLKEEQEEVAQNTQQPLQQPESQTSETTTSLSLNIIKVQNQVEVQNVITKIKNGEQVIINMSALTGQDLTRSLDFLTGAVFALDKTMQKVDTAIYIIQ
ncbi:MAG: cell division protein SepF [Clostridiales bacterium]|nr:cell division protein SepF [Clostridiales bacterium]